jgi:hypothetical protein
VVSSATTTIVSLRVRCLLADSARGDHPVRPAGRTLRDQRHNPGIGGEHYLTDAAR